MLKIFGSKKRCCNNCLRDDCHVSRKWLLSINTAIVNETFVQGSFPNEKLAQIYLSYSLLEVTIFINYKITHIMWTGFRLSNLCHVLNLLVDLCEGSYSCQLLNPPGTLWTEVWQQVFCCNFRKYVVFHILSVSHSKPNVLQEEVEKVRKLCNLVPERILFF